MTQNDCLHMSALELHLLQLFCGFYLLKMIIEVIQQPVANLTHKKPMFHFYSPRKHNTSGFLMFSEGIEMHHRLEMD